MKLLWNESLRLNTVHVDDVVASMWYLANCPAAERQIYNVVDDAQSTQGTLSAMLSDIFAIKVDYWGTVVSSITKVILKKKKKIIVSILNICCFFCAGKHERSGGRNQ